jgi:hypothetical protein
MERGSLLRAYESARKLPRALPFSKPIPNQHSCFAFAKSSAK